MATGLDVIAAVEETAADADFAAAWADIIGSAGPVLGIEIGDAGLAAVAGITIFDPLAWVLAGVALFIAYFAKWLIFDPFAALCGGIPFVGPYLAGVITQLGDDEQRGVQVVCSAALHALVTLVHLIGSLIRLPGEVIRTAYYTIVTLGWVKNTQVPILFNTAIAHADNDMGAVNARATSLYDAAIATAAYDLAVAKSYSNDLYNAAVQRADADKVQAEAYADAKFNAANAHADALNNLTNTRIAQDEAALEIDLARMRSYVDLQFNDARTQAQQDAAAAEAAANAHTDQQVGQTKTELLGDLGALGASLNALGQIVQDRIPTDKAQCLDEQCQSNGQGNKNALNLMALGKAGLVWAFFAEAINNPRGFADATSGPLSDFAAPVGAMMDALVASV